MSRLLLPALRTILQFTNGKYILLAIIGMCKCYIFTIIIPSPTFTIFTVVSSSDVSCKFHSCDRLRAITHVVSQKRSRCWRLIFVLALILGPHSPKKSLTDAIQFRPTVVMRSQLWPLVTSIMCSSGCNPSWSSSSQRAAALLHCWHEPLHILWAQDPVQSSRWAGVGVHLNHQNYNVLSRNINSTDLV